MTAERRELGINLSFPVDVIIEVPEGEDKTAGREAVIRDARTPSPFLERKNNTLDPASFPRGWTAVARAHGVCTRSVNVSQKGPTAFHLDTARSAFTVLRSIS